MGLFDRFKKVKSNRENINISHDNENNAVMNENPKEKILKRVYENKKNFKYLDELIHSGAKEIILDTNIVLEDGEESQYLEGIKLDVDNLVVDGNGFAVDANEKTRIFYCTGKNITIKNIILGRGFTEDDGGAIYNRGGELTITESSLQENTAHGGGAIGNKGRLTIIRSTFKHNTADIAGAIVNGGKSKSTITESTFTGNAAKIHGGAITSIWGELTVTGSTFTGNSAKEFGGAIDNDENTLTVSSSTFTENTARKGGAISESAGECIITKSIFTENMSKEGGGAIHLAKSKKYKSKRCTFKNNKPTDVFKYE